MHRTSHPPWFDSHIFVEAYKLWSSSLCSLLQPPATSSLLAPNIFLSTNYGLDDWGSNPGGGWEFFPSPPRPDRLWDPPSLLFNGYGGIFPWGLSGREVKLTTHLHLIPRSKNVWNYTSTPLTRLLTVVLSWAQFTLFLDTLNICCSLNVRDQVSHPHKPADIHRGDRKTKYSQQNDSKRFLNLIYIKLLRECKFDISLSIQ
jgi:hypothetical protein